MPGLGDFLKDPELLNAMKVTSLPTDSEALSLQTFINLFGFTNLILGPAVS